MFRTCVEPNVYGCKEYAPNYAPAVVLAALILALALVAGALLLRRSRQP